MQYTRNPLFDPKQEFADRLSRIEAGGLCTNRTLFVGNEDQIVLPRGTFAARRKKRRMGPVFVIMVMLWAAGIMGVMAQASLL